MKKCIYCYSEISQDSVMDVCNGCGYQVWGEKMFSAIKQNMENARESGDLFQGSVTDEPSKNLETPKQENSSFEQSSHQSPQPQESLAGTSSALFNESQSSQTQQSQQSQQSQTSQNNQQPSSQYSQQASSQGNPLSGLVQQAIQNQSTFSESSENQNSIDNAEEFKI